MSMVFSGSTMARRAGCPGSGSMEASVEYPEVESEPAKRGTDLHSCMAHLPLGLPRILAEAEILGRDTEDDIAALRWCYEKAPALADSSFVYEVEQPREMKWLHHACKETTPDLVLYRSDEILIVDYKFGHTEVADAADNLQLDYYAVSVAEGKSFEKLFVCVLQPALDKSTTAVYTKQEVESTKLRLLTVINTALDNPDDLRTGEHCRYCRAKFVCPVVSRELVRFSRKELVREKILALPVSRLEDMYSKLAVPEIIIKEVKARMYANLSMGGGEKYCLKEGKKLRSWKSEGSAKEALMRLELEKPELAGRLVVTAPASPARVEEQLGKSKVVREVLTPLLEYHEGKKVIVRKVETASVARLNPPAEEAF